MFFTTINFYRPSCERAIIYSEKIATNTSRQLRRGEEIMSKRSSSPCSSLHVSSDWYFSDSAMLGRVSPLHSRKKLKPSQNVTQPPPKLHASSHKSLPKLYAAEQQLLKGLFIPKLLQPSLPDIRTITKKNDDYDRAERRRKSVSAMSFRPQLTTIPRSSSSMR
jgi:hypothetical protein